MRVFTLLYLITVANAFTPTSKPDIKCQVDQVDGDISLIVCDFALIEGQSVIITPIK